MLWWVNQWIINLLLLNLIEITTIAAFRFSWTHRCRSKYYCVTNWVSIKQVEQLNWPRYVIASLWTTETNSFNLECASNSSTKSTQPDSIRTKWTIKLYSEFPFSQYRPEWSMLPKSNANKEHLTKLLLKYSRMFIKNIVRPSTQNSELRSVIKEWIYVLYIRRKNKINNKHPANLFVHARMKGLWIVNGKHNLS